jgi:hypothetical protein
MLLITTKKNMFALEDWKILGCSEIYFIVFQLLNHHANAAFRIYYHILWLSLYLTRPGYLVRELKNRDG